MLMRTLAQHQEQDLLRSPKMKKNPNVLVWSVKARERWLKTLHDRIQVSMLVYGSNKKEEKWSQAHPYMHARPRWGPLNQIQILSQKGKKTWEFGIKDDIFRVLSVSVPNMVTNIFGITHHL